MEKYTLDEIKTQLPSYLSELGCELRFTGENRFKCRCPLHQDTDPSFGATLKDDAWQWFCHPCAKGGDLIRLHALLHGLSDKDAIRELRERYEGNCSLPPSPQSPRRATPAPVPVTPPMLHRGSFAELQAVARLRGLPVEAARHADSLGWLKFCSYLGHNCYAFTDHNDDRVMIQFRRMDGQPINGAKAYNWPGSRLVPIGSNHLGGDTLPVMIAEGAISILELLALCFHSPHNKTCPDWACLAMPSASSRLSDSLLEKLRGRTVRILGDADAAGDEATAKWIERLQGVAGRIQRVNLRKLPMLEHLQKADLGDLLAAPESHEKNQILEALTKI